MQSLLSHQPARPNVYIGLVGAVGTDLTSVKDQLRGQFAVYGYRCVDLKVSEAIGELFDYKGDADEFHRISALMDYGDKLRRASEDGEAVAAAAIAKIRQLRSEDENLDQDVAFIIDSLKHPSEIDLLDKVYGRNFYTVSVYLNREERHENLIKKIARGQGLPPNSELHGEQADQLIEKDEKGKDERSQNVRDTFPKADFFIDSSSGIADQIRRFVDLLFGKPFIAPTPDEYGMYVARASASRSVDLSRQVGAAIFDGASRVIATGCNEVPYPSGGIFSYPSELIGDNRDHTRQVDPNAVQIQDSLIDLIKTFRDVGYLADGCPTDGDAARELLTGKFKDAASNLRIRNLTEFGRIVHAEMGAICEAASAGRQTRGATLYVTTFPCHGCARHIIAAGLAEVVYIEPYPKSLTTALYAAEISYRHNGNHLPTDWPERVTFRPFHGISPTLYQRVFKHRVGKDAQGTIRGWKPLIARPIGAVYSVERPAVEQMAVDLVAEALDSVRDTGDNSGGQSDDGKRVSGTDSA